MSVVYLIRHGRASFGEEDYDRLSEQGLTQSRILGAALRPRLSQVQLIATGTLRRHQDTAAACLAQLGEAAAAGPPMQKLTGLDEMDHGELLSRLDPRYADRAQLGADIVKAGDPQKGFQEIFTRAVARWTDGNHDGEYTVTWPGFRRRCLAALDLVFRSLGPSGTALVFTSAGPIAAICQQLLGTPDRDAFRLTWALVNCGVSKVLQGSRGPVLSTVNEHAHFEGVHRNLITYR